MNFKIKEVKQEEVTGAWNDFAFSQSLPNYSIGHNPCLPGIFKKLFNFQTIHCMIYDEEKVIGLFQAVKEDEHLMSLPILSTSGLCYDPAYSRDDIYKSIKAYFNNPFEIRDFKKISIYSFDKKVTCYLPLQATADEQMDFFKSKLRNQIKKGYANGLEVNTGGIELLSSFYDIYIKNMHRLGVPHPSKNYFENFIKNYQNGECKIFVISNNSIPVGASIVFTYGKLAELFWASTTQKYNHLNTNMVLYWEAIKYSIEQKLSMLSFGRSDIGSNSLRFKEQWGVDVHPIYFNYSSAHTNLRDHTLINRVWKNIPFPIVKILGPIIRSKVTS